MALDCPPSSAQYAPSERALGGAGRGLVATSVRLGLVLIVAGGLGLLGSVHRGPLVALAAVSLPLAALTVLDRGGLRLRVPAPAWVLMALGSYTAAQCVPLPRPVLAWLAPSNASIWEDAARASGRAWRFAPLTADPAGSREECLKWLVYAGVVILAAHTSRRLGPRWVPGLVASTALGAALVTLGHGVVRAQTYLGVYRPVEAVQHWAVGPLLNPNNLAGYLNLGVFCLLGSFYSRHGRVPRSVAGLGAVLLIAVSASCASRAGLSSLLLGLLAYPFLLRAAGRGPRGGAWPRLRSVPVALAGVVSAGVAVAMLAGGHLTWRGLFAETLGKLDVYPWLWDMLRDFPWFGSGRGSFDGAFPAYSRGSQHVRYQYAENVLAQWLVEWGIVATALALGALLWSYRGAIRLRRLSTCGVSTVVGLAVLLLHNMLDLSLELPGVAVAVAALLGSLWVEASGSRAVVPRGAAPGRHYLAVLAATLLLLGLPLAVHVGSSMERGVEARQRLKGALEAREQGVPELLREVEELASEHPADPYFPLVSAVLAAKAGTGSDLRWAAQAIRRAPHSGRAHLVLARLLAMRGAKGQALGAALLAATHEPALAETAASFVARVSRDPVALVHLLSSSSLGADFLVLVARQRVIAREYRLRLALLEEAVQRAPGDSEPARALILALLECLERRDAACTGERGAQREARVASLMERFEGEPSARQWLTMPAARHLVLRGQSPQAFELLAARCGGAEQKRDCFELALRTSSSSASDEALRSVVRGYLGAACLQPRPCAAPSIRAAAAYSERGMWKDAADLLERAAEVEGSRALWSRLADAANRAGDAARALRALRRAERAEPR